MGFRSGVVRGELDPVAPELARPCDGGTRQETPDPLPPMPGMHVHRLNFGAQTSLRLQVSEDDELADPDHLVAHLGHEDTAGAGGNLVQGGGIGGELIGILFAIDQRAVLEELDYGSDVRRRSFPQDDVTRKVGPIHAGPTMPSMSLRWWISSCRV